MFSMPIAVAWMTCGSPSVASESSSLARSTLLLSLSNNVRQGGRAGPTGDQLSGLVALARGAMVREEQLAAPCGCYRGAQILAPALNAGSDRHVANVSRASSRLGNVTFGRSFASTLLIITPSESTRVSTTRLSRR